MKPYPVREYGYNKMLHADACAQSFTGCLEDNGFGYYYIDGQNSPHTLFNTPYTEVDLCKHLYKENPSPELMALILELQDE